MISNKLPNGTLDPQAKHVRQIPISNTLLEARSTTEQRDFATHRLVTLGEMTGGIAHDFRNLLAVIDSGMRLAGREADNPERVRVYIAAAREGINRGLELTSELLAFAKQQTFVTDFGDVNKCLRTFEPFLSYGAGPDIRITLELEPNLPACLIDPALFNVAVLNLVINARDAMPNGGEVRIITERLVQNTSVPNPPGRGDYVRVRVKDHGQGMTPEDLRKVFNPFFTTKGQKGTGIGLPQVQAFMQIVGGQVSIASEQGIGTTVYLWFPSMQSNDQVQHARIDSLPSSF